MVRAPRIPSTLVSVGLVVSALAFGIGTASCFPDPRDHAAQIMASFLNLFGTLGQFLTPPPAYTDYEYDGLEYRWTIFVFRPARESQVQTK